MSGRRSNQVRLFSSFICQCKNALPPKRQGIQIERHPSDQTRLQAAAYRRPAMWASDSNHLFDEITSYFQIVADKGEGFRSSTNGESMKTVITYGTFDLFHIGHVNLLRRLRAMGDRLVVGCSSDEFNRMKSKEVVIPYADRADILSACRYVDDVFPEHNWEQKRPDIIREKAAIFAMGHDWEGKFDFLSDIVEVVYLPRTDGVSTTEIRQKIETVAPSVRPPHMAA